MTITDLPELPEFIKTQLNQNPASLNNAQAINWDALSEYLGVLSAYVDALPTTPLVPTEAEIQTAVESYKKSVLIPSTLLDGNSIDYTSIGVTVTRNGNNYEITVNRDVSKTLVQMEDDNGVIISDSNFASAVKDALNSKVIISLNTALTFDLTVIIL